MATSYVKQATKQLAPVYDQQIKAAQSQIGDINNLYQTLIQGLQTQYDTNLASGVNDINEDAAARGVLRSTLPNDSRAALTTQLGAALQQSLGRLSQQKSSDLFGVNQQIGQLQVGKATGIQDLAAQLANMDYQKQQAAQQQALLRAQAAAQQAQASASAGSGGSGLQLIPKSGGGIAIYNNGVKNQTDLLGYVAANGGNYNDLVGLLERYGDKQDKVAAKAYRARIKNGMSMAEAGAKLLVDRPTIDFLSR